MKVVLVLVLVLVLGAVAGCSGTSEFKVDPSFDPTRPQRIAVLPFVDRATGDNFLSKPFTPAMDIVPILSDDRLTREHGPTIFRQELVSNVRRGTAYVIPPDLVDGALKKHKVDVLAEYDAEDRAAVAKRFGKLLDADVIAFGEVTHWDRRFYVIDTEVWAGLRLELRAAVDGRRLAWAEVSDFESYGASDLPIATSGIDVVLMTVGNALKGLGNTSFALLAHDVSRQIMEGLRIAAVRGKYGEEALAKAAAPPEVKLVAHSAEGPLAVGATLLVVAVGDPNCQVVFRIGVATGPTLMSEVAPGTSIGTRPILPGDRFRDEKLVIRFVSPLLRSTVVMVEAPLLSTADDLAAAAPGPPGSAGAAKGGTR